MPLNGYLRLVYVLSFFFFNDTAPTEIYPLSLHDALPISGPWWQASIIRAIASSSPITSASTLPSERLRTQPRRPSRLAIRSEEHTSELQSLAYLVCRLLLEKKRKSRTREPHRRALP